MMDSVKRVRRRYLYLSVAAFIACLLFQILYRPYISSHQINDLGIAGSSVSFWGPLCAMFYFSYRDVSAKPTSIAITTSLGASIYECIQPHIKLGYFDWLDILASFLAGLFYIFLVNLVGNYRPGVTV